jgi:predicted NBD/HSP70 family sugar kinase
MGNLTDLHDNNVGLILQTLQKHHSLARNELATLTGLTRTTVSNVVASLIAKNLVYEVEQGEASARGGRKPILLQIYQDALAMIGLDLRREKVSGCLVNLGGEILARVSHNLPLGTPSETYWDTFDSIINYLKSQRDIPILGIGLGSIGPLDLEAGRLLSAPHFESMTGARLCDKLQERHGLPVMLRTGASAAALGEHFWTMNEASQMRSLAFVVIDYGLGLGMISDKALWETYGKAGELGHTTLNPNGDICVCGRRGCLELYASGKTLLKQVHDRIGTNLDLSQIARHAEAGDSTLQQLIAEAGYLLGYAIIDIDKLLRPDCIIIGSSHEHLNTWYLAGIKRHIVDLKTNGFDIHLIERLALASRGSYAIAFGAATLQLKAFYESPLNIINQLNDTVSERLSTDHSFQHSP